MKKRWGTFAICVLAVLVLDGVANAGAILFRIPGNDPSIFGQNSLSFSGNPLDGLIGTNIVVDAVIGSGTPLNDGVAIPCINCFLNFATGPSLGGGTDGWFFSPGGGVVLTGSLDVGLGTPVDLIPFAFTGFFTGAPVVLDGFPDPDLVRGFALAAILDGKHPALTGFFGMPITLYEGTIFLEIAGFGNAPGGLTAEVKEGFVINSPIPEPGVLSLCFAGLCGLVALGRRSSRFRRTD